MRKTVNRDEYNAMLATTPATPNQVGAIHREFARLGFGEDDRAARLAISAVMLGLDSLRSTRDLPMGEAGRLVGMLRATRDRSELPAPGRPDTAAAADDAGTEGERLTLAALIKAIVIIHQAPEGPP